MKNSEIEAKLKVQSHEQIRERLNELGALFIDEQYQSDFYFDKPDGTLTKTDRCLRIRHSQSGRTKKIILTYKGRKQKDDFKKRTQFETKLGDSEPIEKIFNEIGYSKKLLVEKKRQSWLLNKCEVALDQVPGLGKFVEIEGPDSQKIHSVKKRLGLEKLKNITESYAFLLQKKTLKNKAKK